MSGTDDASAFPAPAAVPPPDRPPRRAATIVVVRDAADGGIDVLLSRRAERGDHNSGAWVFPGGLVDAADAEAHAACSGLDDAAASRRLGVAAGGLDYYVAAIRECFEESGVLFAFDRAGSLVTLDGEAASRLVAWRVRLHRGEIGIGAFCANEGLRLAAGHLVYLSHWLTPLGRPKRFDTRFFIARLPPAQTAAHDGNELVEQLWLKPADALAQITVLKLLTPTQSTLATVGGFEDVASLMAWAKAPRAVPLVMPRVAAGAAGFRPVLPDEPAWAEIGHLDPAGHGHASYEIVPGRAVRLSERVVRVTAPNASAMTGPGTNTYLVGGLGGAGWAVIDPGPATPLHVEAIVAAAPGPIDRILVTHTHTDHSPAAAALRARTGAPVLGLAPLHQEWQDDTFAADETLRGGERITLAPATHLRVIHTPGHAANHLCYLLEEEKTLFTGDHLMQASTVVINPPDGDMAAYVASLRALMSLDLDWLAPGHGFLMAEPRAAMEAVIVHRLKREAKVVTGLMRLGSATLDELLPVVYDDVPARLHAMARRSLEAHLLKLAHDGRAGQAAGRWALRPDEPVRRP